MKNHWTLDPDGAWYEDNNGWWVDRTPYVTPRYFTLVRGANAHGSAPTFGRFDTAEEAMDLADDIQAVLVGDIDRQMVQSLVADRDRFRRHFEQLERILKVLAGEALVLIHNPVGYPPGSETIEALDASFAPEEFDAGDFDRLKGFL